MLESPVAGSKSAGSTGPGPWPSDFELTSSGGVEEGLVVLSRTGEISGRTTGSRRTCTTIGCPGWFVGVRWETGQLVHACSEGWHYEAATRVIRITGGGEISARVVSPKPFGVAPLPRAQWPARASLSRLKGWRVASSG
jgi:hypothetical protein